MGYKGAEASYEGIRSLFVFLFFLMGALFSRALLSGREIFASEACVYALCFGAVLVFSASVWGMVLLPGCALAFGCVTGGYAERIVQGLYSGGNADLRGLLVNAVAVPLFFLVTVRGMRISSMLGAMLDRYNSSARADYNREYIPVAMTVLTGILVVYLLLG